ncbi:MAG TPA: GNAT family N-acetyltransferase [Trinickia sp.]|nr:GNAT family N-acetyltransferase [Trinickia sp.]
MNVDQSSKKNLHEPGSVSGLSIRTHEPSADMNALAALLNLPGVRHGTLMQPYVLPSTLARRDATRGEPTVRLCAKLEGKLVGAAVLAVHKPRRSHCGVLAIQVHDACVGKGIGSALLSAIVDCADRQLGLRRIELTVYADNAPAIALYRKFGFIEEGRSPAYGMRDGVLADVLHMARLVAAPAFASREG